MGLFDLELRTQIHQILVTALFVNLGDHVGSEVDDLFQVLRSQIQHVAQSRGNTLEVPDVGDGSGKVDVTHALTTHLGARHLNTALFADDALVAHALVLTTRAFPVAGGAEDLLTEQTVTLGLERTVVDGLRLLHFTVAPRGDIVARG